VQDLRNQILKMAKFCLVQGNRQHNIQNIRSWFEQQSFFFEIDSSRTSSVGIHSADFRTPEELAMQLCPRDKPVLTAFPGGFNGWIHAIALDRHCLYPCAYSSSATEQFVFDYQQKWS
jgi:hypothetical protein